MPFPHLPAPFRLIVRVHRDRGGGRRGLFREPRGREWGPVVRPRRLGARRADRRGDCIHADLPSSVRPDAALGAPLRRTPFLRRCGGQDRHLSHLHPVRACARGVDVTGPGRNAGLPRQDVLFSLAISFVFAFMYEINSLLGQNALTNFITGRYHKPRLESRADCRSHSRHRSPRAAARRRQTLARRPQAARQGRRSCALCVDQGAPTRSPGRGRRQPRACA